MTNPRRGTHHFSNTVLGVLILNHDTTLTVEELSAVLIRDHHCSPDQTYYQKVYGTLHRLIKIGNVTRERPLDHPGSWRYRLEDTMRDLVAGAVRKYDNNEP
jgi:hypothetical protein